MNYPHIVFDIDNTLIDTTAAVLHSLQKAIREVTGEHWEISRLTPVLGIPGLNAFEMLGIRSPEQIFKIYPLWEQYMYSYQHTAYLYEGILPLLGIITSKTMEQYKNSFIPFGIGGMFRTVITADDTKQHKPHPAPMNTYMWLEDTDASRCSMWATASMTWIAPGQRAWTAPWPCGAAVIPMALYPPTVLPPRKA